MIISAKVSACKLEYIYIYKWSSSSGAAADQLIFVKMKVELFYLTFQLCQHSFLCGNVGLGHLSSAAWLKT